ncbi:MAG: hypothetical protein HQM12_14140 [SAR324 cluster bacterium]|nr:hypothetical protein [SAR324 cluster bacterium]
MRKWGITTIWFIVMIISLVGCQKRPERTFKVSTSYYDHKEQESHQTDTDMDALLQGIGQYKFDALVAGLGEANLQRMVYEAGHSNIIDLINQIGDPQKLVSLMSGDNALSVTEVLTLLNATDEMIRVENPPSQDTIGKIANVINNVHDMNSLKDIVHGMLPYQDLTGIERLSLVIALVDEQVNTMPNLLNDVAGTAEGKAKLLKILNEVEELKKLTTFINNLLALSNATNLINSVDSAGMEALITTVRLTGSSEMIATLVNLLDVQGVVSNDEDFEGTASQTWAVSSTGGHMWVIDNQQASGGQNSAGTPEGMAHNEVLSAEMFSHIITAGTMNFHYKVSTESGHDYLKFYIDDVLQGKISGETGWSQSPDYYVEAGVHRFRWEYEKDASGSAGQDRIWLDNIVLPGNKGTLRTPYEKVAILLNQLKPQIPDAIPQILNGLSSAGMVTLTRLLNGIEYPQDIQDEPRLVSIVNGIQAIPTIIELLNGINDNGAVQLLSLANYIDNTTGIVDLINGLAAQGSGRKAYDLINAVNSTGVFQFVRVLDVVEPSDIVTIADGIFQTSHLAEILNNLYLNGQKISQEGQTGGYTGGHKVTDAIMGIKADANLSIGYHLVRLINDIAVSGTHGAKNVADIINGMEPPTTASPEYGITKMVKVLSGMSAHDETYLYKNPTDSGYSDKFGRLTTLINSISESGASSVVKIINGMEVAHLTALTQLVADISQIRQISELINQVDDAENIAVIFNNLDQQINPNGVTKLKDVIHLVDGNAQLEIQHLARLINDLASQGGNNGARNVARIINGLTPVSVSTQETGIIRVVLIMQHLYAQDSGNIYTSPDQTGTSDQFGRLTTLINAISANGTDNVVILLNNLSNQKIQDLGYLLTHTGRIRYVSDLVNRMINVRLLTVILNGVNSIGSLTQIVNDIGGSTISGSVVNAKAVGDMTILADTINLLGYQADRVTPRSPTEQQRINTLINGINSCGVGPTNSSQSETLYDLDSPWSHLRAEGQSYCREYANYGSVKRLSSLLLGLNSAVPLSPLVGDVTDTMKTVKVVNGIRDIQQLINLVNYLPGQVLSTFLNTIDSSDAVVYGSVVFLLNRLNAQELAALLHYGTGLPGDSSCSYFTGVGPQRLGTLLSAETGPRLNNLLNKFGVRHAIAAVDCGLATPNAGTPQDFDNRHSGGGRNISLGRTEELRIDSAPRYPGGTGAGYTHTYRASESACKNFYSEKAALTGWLFLCPNKSQEIDKIIWESYSFCLVVKAGPGLAAVWDIVNGEGFVGTLVDKYGAASIPSPTNKNPSSCQVNPAVDNPVH